jgi:hypothetical protein
VCPSNASIDDQESVPGLAAPAQSKRPQKRVIAGAIRSTERRDREA